MRIDGGAHQGSECADMIFGKDSVGIDLKEMLVEIEAWAAVPRKNDKLVKRIVGTTEPRAAHGCVISGAVPFLRILTSRLTPAARISCG